MAEEVRMFLCLFLAVSEDSRKWGSGSDQKSNWKLQVHI